MGIHKLLSLAQALRGKAGSLVGRGNVDENISEDSFEQVKERFRLCFKEWLGKQAISQDAGQQERERGRKPHRVN